MKRFIALLVVLLTSMSVAFAQGRNRGLVLNGSVQRVGTECINNEWFARIEVYLQFHNDSTSPVILYPPSSMFAAAIKYGTGNKSFHVVDSFRYRPYLRDRYGVPTEDDFDPHPGIPNRLDRDHPLLAGMMIIEPGAYYEFTDTFWPKSGFKIGVTPQKLPRGYDPPEYMKNQPCGLTRADAVSEYRTFRIKYDLGLRKYRDASDLLTKLQARWKPLGNFLLASNDDISYESEEIILDIRK